MADARQDVRRVVSLAPSATATLFAMGAAETLVGVTHHCRVGAMVDERGADAGTGTGDGNPGTGNEGGDADDSAELPVRIGGWLNPDPDRVDRLDPDLVVTCDALQADLADEFSERGHHVHHSEPSTLDETIASFTRLGEAIGRPTAGGRLTANAQSRLAAIDETIEASVEKRGRPVVYCEEWSDPPMAAGNWVPDAVHAAGGRYPFVEPGERSRRIDGPTVAAADPDHVVLHVCGRGERSDPAVVRERGWTLDAPIHVLDDALLNQPSPTLIEGVERLARTLHPESFPGEDRLDAFPGEDRLDAFPEEGRLDSFPEPNR